MLNYMYVHCRIDHSILHLHWCGRPLLVLIQCKNSECMTSGERLVDFSVQLFVFVCKCLHSFVSGCWMEQCAFNVLQKQNKHFTRAYRILQRDHILLEPTGSDVNNCISKGKTQVSSNWNFLPFFCFVYYFCLFKLTKVLCAFDCFQFYQFIYLNICLVRNWLIRSGSKRYPSVMFFHFNCLIALVIISQIGGHDFSRNKFRKSLSISIQ